MKTALFALVAVLVACHSEPPPKPAANDLEIQRMPAGAVASQAVAVAPAPPEAYRGTCGQQSVGNPAPPITHAKAGTGKVTVVYFWATWCGPCGKDFPAYQALYAKNKDRGLEVVGISVDDERDGINDFVRQHNTTFPVGWDAEHKDASCWHIGTMPTTFVVDREGIVRFIHEGFVGQDGTASGDVLADEVEKLL